MYVDDTCVFQLLLYSTPSILFALIKSKKKKNYNIVSYINDHTILLYLFVI